MAFTGEVVYGWRVASMKDGRRPMHATGAGAWTDEPVIELVKGDRHIRARGQEGIDPQIVFYRAVSAALADDMKQLHILGRDDEFLHLAKMMEMHERRRKLYENGWMVERMKQNGGAVFQAGTARVKGVISGSN